MRVPTVTYSTRNVRAEAYFTPVRMVGGGRGRGWGRSEAGQRRSTMAWANSEHLTGSTPSSMRAKS
jgi:hypothetical protein